MFNISEESIRFLEKYIPEYENYTLSELFDELHCFIVREGMVRQQYLNELGHRAQSVYDDLYENG